MRQHDDGLIFAGTVFARNRRIPNSTFYDIETFAKPKN